MCLHKFVKLVISSVPCKKIPHWANVGSIWIRADDAYMAGEIYILQDLKMCDSLLRKTFFRSGVARVWQAWHVPWAPLWWGRKNCLAKFKICHLQFLFWAPCNDSLHSCIATAPVTNAIIRTCCASAKHCDKTGVLWQNTTVGHCDRTRTLACNIYKTWSSRYKKG